MDFSSNIDLIIRDLTEVCEIIDDLKHYPGVPAFQVEIAKSKCRSAAELIALLKNIRELDQSAAKVKIANPPGLEINPEAVLKSAAVIEVENIHPDIPVFELSNEVIEHQKEVKDVKEVKEAKEIRSERVEKKEPEKEKEKISGQSIIADRFIPVSSSLYEQIGKVAGADEMPELTLAKPIASLTEAIGINDRFLFIGELFKGDKNAYFQAISQLDNTKNYPEAHSIVMSIPDSNEESEAIKHLLMIIKRKHPSNE